VGHYQLKVVTAFGYVVVNQQAVFFGLGQAIFGCLQAGGVGVGVTDITADIP